MSDSPATPTVPQVALIGVFVASLITAQLTASKVLAFGLPTTVPVVGPELVLPGAALAYALTFLASDCYTELYGRRAAAVMVNVAFLLNFLVLALVWSTILAPGHPSGVDPAVFETALGASTNVVLGSLLAYLLSQNWDVWLFHAIRERTGPRLLWLRNLLSTATSQAVDTVVFVTVAFAIAPAILGVGEVLALPILLSLIVGQYLLKLAIAVLDTPVVYVVVGLVRDRRDAGTAVAADA